MPTIGRMRGHVVLAVAFAALAFVTGAAAATPGVHKRFVVDRTIVSPDGNRVASLAHLVSRDLPEESVRVATVGEPTRILYRSSDGCCTHFAWLSPTRLIFDDDYRVMTLDVTTGEISRIAVFSDFRISPDHEWIAGWADSGGHSAQTIRVGSADGASCRSVPTPAGDTDLDASFSQDGTVHVYRASFSAEDGAANTGHWVTFRLESLPRAPVSACLS